MWKECFWISILCFWILPAVLFFIVKKSKYTKKRRYGVFNYLFAGVSLSTFVMFLPIHWSDAVTTLWGGWRTVLLSVFNAMQVFAIGCDYSVVKEAMTQCPDSLEHVYHAWASTLFVLAPIFTFGFVLSLFKNLSAYIRYLTCFFNDVYVFSELNEKSLVLAEDVKKHDKKAVIVFTDVFEDKDEKSYELMDSAKNLGALCFKNDILVLDFKKHSRGKNISFFTMGSNLTENLNQGLALIEEYRNRKNTNIYVFSTGIEGEILLTSIDKGQVKVRRINEVKSLINRILYERGEIIFDSARENEDGLKQISAVVVGMGRHGTEMVKALTWFGQMDGYSLEINAFDKDVLAKEKFTAAAPELMSEKYNGVTIAGEAQYKITVHSGLDVDTSTFAAEISKLKDTTYVLVALGSDDININTAINLRMYFERLKIHPVIQAIVYNSQQKKALQGIKNYRGQEYDIEFVGDLESSYISDVIIDSELEDAALQRHLKWGKEEEFWTYEYNYKSSMASAIHMKARIKCGIQGADKKEEELTEAESLAIETLEHRRWNAYMRAEGYVYSGSTDKSSRNDLAKMHHDLVDYSKLDSDEKLKDRKVGTQ